MTKQEEIFLILQDVRLGELSEYEATLKLHELGVVIKVDRIYRCEDCQYYSYDSGTRSWEGRPSHNCAVLLDLTKCPKNIEKHSEAMLKAGYVAVEPLIKEEK